MAEEKKSFIMYTDFIGTFEELSDDEAGKLIKHIFRYVNDLDPVTDDKLVKIAFGPIKQQLKRDLKKYEKTKERKSDAGKKGMEVRWSKKENTTTDNSVITDITEHNSVINAITPITDNDTVNVTVTVNDNGTESVKVNLIDTFFVDLPNSSHIFSICRDLGYSKEYVLSMVSGFRGFVEVSYPSFEKFVNHFKGWLRKNPPPSTLKKMVY